MKDRTLLRTGIIGALVAGVCCFTPLLVIGLGALGFSALVGGLDYVLLPGLGLSIVIIVFALIRIRAS